MYVDKITNVLEQTRDFALAPGDQGSSDVMFLPNGVISCTNNQFANWSIQVERKTRKPQIVLKSKVGETTELLTLSKSGVFEGRCIRGGVSVLRPKTSNHQHEWPMLIDAYQFEKEIKNRKLNEINDKKLAGGEGLTYLDQMVPEYNWDQHKYTFGDVVKSDLVVCGLLGEAVNTAIDRANRLSEMPYACHPMIFIDSIVSSRDPQNQTKVAEGSIRKIFEESSFEKFQITSHPVRYDHGRALIDALEKGFASEDTKHVYISREIDGEDFFINALPLTSSALLMAIRSDFENVGVVSVKSTNQPFPVFEDQKTFGLSPSYEKLGDFVLCREVWEAIKEGLYFYQSSMLYGKHYDLRPRKTIRKWLNSLFHRQYSYQGAEDKRLTLGFNRNADRMNFIQNLNATDVYTVFQVLTEVSGFLRLELNVPQNWDVTEEITKYKVM
jgi:hypothetical protein